MRVGIFVVMTRNREINLWLEDYDSTTEDDFGYGKVVLTDDPAKAKVFRHVGEAAGFWCQASRTVPIRDADGGVNRPLTQFTVTIMPIPNIG